MFVVAPNENQADGLITKFRTNFTAHRPTFMEVVSSVLKELFFANNLRTDKLKRLLYANWYQTALFFFQRKEYAITEVLMKREGSLQTMNV